MKDQIDQVAHFMEDAGQSVRYQPVTKISPRERMLRIALLLEEVKELATSFGVNVSVYVDPHIEQPTLDPADVLDHLTDIAYVLYGTYCTCGLQSYAEPGFDEVHRSNLSKRDADGSILKNEIGKIIKGPNYSPPDLQAVIDRTRYARENTP